jgi:copper chaperone
METLTLHVTGMTCGGCENAVKRALSRLEGVLDATASHGESRVTVTYDPGTVGADAIRQRIRAAGYVVTE